MSDDLVKRSDAMQVALWFSTSELKYSRQFVKRRVMEIPTAEPKRGEWIFKTVFPNDKSEFPMGYLVCSVCGSHHSNSTPCNYCDNCGADMRDKDDE
jgi:rubrerythrin